MNKRLHSLDALRGFDMFWIMGTEELIHALAKATSSPFWVGFSEQLTHPEWHGFSAYDLIFPLFLFISGVSVPYSIEQNSQKNGRRILKRCLLLVLLGIVYNNGLEIKSLEEIRFASVLGRIGLAYLGACLIYLYASTRWQMIWFASLLLGYWAFLVAFSPDLSMENNVVSWFDRHFLIGRLHKTIHDPEGFLSTIPAIATGLLGIFTGGFLKTSLRSPEQKTLKMLQIGFILLSVSVLWNRFLPINKNLWTSSFVFCTGGLSLIMLALFYFLIDVKGWKTWAYCFMLIGMNSILIYLSDRLIHWKFSSEAVFQWLAQLFPERFYEAVILMGVLVLKVLFLKFLYDKKVFLRV